MRSLPRPPEMRSFPSPPAIVSSPCAPPIRSGARPAVEAVVARSAVEQVCAGEPEERVRTVAGIEVVEERRPAQHVRSRAAVEHELIRDPLLMLRREGHRVDAPAETFAAGGVGELRSVRRPGDRAVRVEIRCAPAGVRPVGGHRVEGEAVQIPRRTVAVTDEGNRVAVPRGHPVVPLRRLREVADIRAVETNGIDLEIPVPIRLEGDRLTVRRPCRVDGLV
jgi:hypothetical protein